MSEQAGREKAEVFDKDGQRIGPILYRTYFGFTVENQSGREIKRGEMVYARPKEPDHGS